jgi:hypothetical protein
MKYFSFLVLLFLFHVTAGAKTITASGQCITSTVTLSLLPDSVNGKAAYQATGSSVAGYTNVTVNMYWLDSPYFLWVLGFDGQPYFQNSCNYSKPPSSSDTNCSWTPVSGTACTGTDSLVIGGSGVLAVKLLNFTGTESNRQVLLGWETASESNNKLFEVQRSTDGKTALTKHDAASQNTTIETRILKDQKVEIVVTIANKPPIALSKNLIYNI